MRDKMARKKHTVRKLKQERYTKPKNFNELAERIKINTKNIKTIHDDTEDRMREILSEQSKFEKALVNKDRLFEFDAKKIHEEISKEFDRINNVFVGALDKLKEKTDNLDLEMRTLRE